MNTEKIEQIRADFPILTEKIYNKQLIYFDNAATTQNLAALLKNRTRLLSSECQYPSRRSLPEPKSH